jgi:hypothetical protein
VRRWFTDLDRTTVIDECRAKRKPNGSSAVLMFFFQSQDDTAVSLFESLTKQLVATMIGTSTPCSPEILLALEKAYGNEVSRPEVSQVITDLVLPLCSHLPQITLVIDGVDECKQTELRLIWEGLDRILKHVHAKILISSEDQTNLHLKGSNGSESTRSTIRLISIPTSTNKLLDCQDQISFLAMEIREKTSR